MNDNFVLENGSHIAVIGGGPSGSFFSIFALKMAKMIGKEIKISIYDPKDFTKLGPLGCNRCGGIISELLVQTLAVEGINLPDTLVQRGIDSYRMHTVQGSVYIETPMHEKTIATVYRGGGPKGIKGLTKESFDKFLLDMAVKEGATHLPIKIDKIEYHKRMPAIFSKQQKVLEPDLIVGSIGVKSNMNKILENMEFGYKRPQTVTAAIAEFGMDSKVISEYLGNSVHIFLLPLEKVKFAAMIPKGTYVTLCIIGKDISTDTIKEFIDYSVVKDVLPVKELYSINCQCIPQMNVKAPTIPFHDRVVICGDSGSTRLFKDGLGAAYIMGKAAAKTAVFRGISKKHFQHGYFPVYKAIVRDNQYGKLLFSVTDLLKNSQVFTKSMLDVIQKEQGNYKSKKVLSTILWDMFTGNERYRNIFFRAINVPMFYNLLKSVMRR
jgi:flavin-dependent dehydrogenase